MKPITRYGLTNKIESEIGPVLAEMLPEKYFVDGHLPGAICINIDEVNAMSPKLITDELAEIIIYFAGLICSTPRELQCNSAQIVLRT